MRRLVSLVLLVSQFSGGKGDESLVLWGMEKAAEVWGKSSPSDRYKGLSYAVQVVGALSMFRSIASYHARLEMTPEDRWRIAVHESGHAAAIVSREHRKSYDDRYNLVPRDTFSSQHYPRFELRNIKLNLGASPVEPGGVTAFKFRRKLLAMESKDIETMLSFVFAGRAAEDVLLGRGSAGAQGDLELARYIARAYVEMCFYGPRSARALWDKDRADRATRRLLEASYRDAKNLARKHKTEINYLARGLFLKEKLSAKEARNLMNDAVTKKPPPTDPRGIFSFADHQPPTWRQILRGDLVQYPISTKSTRSHDKSLTKNRPVLNEHVKNAIKPLPASAPSSRTSLLIFSETQRFIRSILLRGHISALIATVFRSLADRQATVDAAPEADTNTNADKKTHKMPPFWLMGARSATPAANTRPISSC